MAEQFVGLLITPLYLLEVTQEEENIGLTWSGHEKMLLSWMECVWREEKSFQGLIVLGGVYCLQLRRMH